MAFADPSFDEARFAKQVADLYGTRHFVETVESDDFDLIDTLAWLYDEPYADSSAIPTYRVCQLARKHVTVALSGDGGDESFGGYRRYRMHLAEERMRSFLPLSLRRPIFGSLAWGYPKADWAPRVFRAKSTFAALARSSVEAYFEGVSILRSPMRRQLFSPAFRELAATLHLMSSRHAARADTNDPLHDSVPDLQTYLVATSTPRSTAPAWRTRSRCASRSWTTNSSSGWPRCRRT
jgi:asparagine synthase (glutamine-hydrolysing)